MSGQPWVWDAATGQYAWRPETVAPPGYYMYSVCRPEENSGPAHPVSYSQEHPAPGLAASDLRGTRTDMPVSNLSAIYTPNTFTYWPATNNHASTFTPSQATPWSVVPQPALSVNHHDPAFIPSQAAPWNEIPQAGTHTKRSPSPAFPYTLPAPSPPPVPARPISVPPQQLRIFLPPPSPPAILTHLTGSSSKTTLVGTPFSSTLSLHGSNTKKHDTSEQSKDGASSSTLVRCYCCLRNPVSFHELGVNWCGECFEMVQSRRQRLSGNEDESKVY